MEHLQENNIQKKPKKYYKKKNSGRKVSEVTKNKICENHWAKRCPEMQSEHAKRIASQSKSDQHKINISNALKKSVKTKQKTVSCPYCGKSGGERAMKRWHFKNCKNKT